MKKTICAGYSIIAAGYLGMLMNPLWSATQGTLGATSTGTITITLTVPNRAQISGLTDVAFTNQDPSTNALNAQDVCVYSNTATKGYTVTASGNGTASAFTLLNGITTIPYTVAWAASSGQTTGTALITTVASTGFVSTAANPTCSVAPLKTASLIVGITSASLQAAVAALTYTGVLTLLITPQ